VSQHYPKKRYSQVFLADKKVVQQIVELLEIKSDDTIFEVGSGRGTLTEPIAATGARLFSFEIDRDLITNLEDKFGLSENVRIINGDFLEVNPADYYGGKFKLIGNIPYDITSPLLDWMTRYRNLIELAVITTQKEMGQRISSGPGTKNWAPISIFCQSVFEIKSVMTIPPKAFFPPPKIFSSTLVFRPVEKYIIENKTNFEKIVRQSFLFRRKILINNLTLLPGLDKKGIEKTMVEMGLDLNCRAEQLSIEDFISLSKRLKPE